MSSTSRSRTPVHFALPTSLPPTSLLTHEIVTYCSNIGSAMSSLPGQRRLAVDQAVDPERPAGRVDARREQRRVDPVEPVVGHDDRGQAGDRGREVRSGRRGRRPSRTRVGSAARRRPARPLPLEQAAGRRRRPRPPPTPTAPARMRNERRDQSGIVAGGAVPASAAHGTVALERSSSQPRTHRPAPDRRSPRRSPPIAGIGERIAERGEEADDAEGDEDRRRDRVVTPREDARDRPR